MSLDNTVKTYELGLGDSKPATKDVKEKETKKKSQYLIGATHKERCGVCSDDMVGGDLVIG